MITPKFIAKAKCYEVKAFDGSIMTKDDTVAYLGESDGWSQWSTSRTAATRFESEEKARSVAKGSSGMPWYFQLKPGTLEVEEVTRETRFMTRAELVAEVERLRALHGL